MTDAANRKLANTAILNIDLQEKFITPQKVNAGAFSYMAFKVNMK